MKLLVSNKQQNSGRAAISKKAKMGSKNGVRVYFPKMGSECTFWRLVSLARTAEFGGAGAVGQLHFDGQTEAVGAEGVLALQVGADSVDVVLGECFHRERAVGGAALFAGGAEREVAGMRLDQRVVPTEGVAGVARPAVVTRVGGHAGANGVEFDVAIAVQKVGFPIDGCGLVAAFPQRAGAAIAVVDVAHVAASQ